MPYVSKINTISNASLLRSLEVCPILRHERPRWDSLMRQHHYLGLKALVGESIRYVATYKGQWLALLGWSAAALNCKVRDRWIGWHPAIKTQRLHLIANNTRFLILPHIRIPNLASRILALNLKRLSSDWERFHGHPVYLAETFVDPRYFKGTCYKASGWKFLGYTSGFAKRSRRYIQHDKPKIVFIYPLQPTVKGILTSPYFQYKFNKEVSKMKISVEDAQRLIELLLKIPDPRKARGIRHQKISILAITICAIMCGMRSLAAISEWAKGCTQDMLKRLWCRYDKKKRKYIPPSEPTIRRLLQKVDAAIVEQAVYGWLRAIGYNDGAIAVDGKTIKGARRENGRSLHVLSAFLHNKGIPVAQCEVEDKTNEITKVKSLLDPLDIKGSVVTMDALHAQKETARYVVEDKKADYLFIVKDNQKTLKKDIEDLNMVAFPPSA